MAPVGRTRARDRSRGKGGAVPRFIPTALANLAVWYRADQGVTLNGSTVSQWNDLSGNGRHLTQGTASAQPLFVANGINGQPAVEFVSTDILDCAAATWGSAVAQPATLYVVAYIDQSTQRDVFDNVAGADRWILGTTAAPNPQPFFFAGSSLLTPTQAVTSATVWGVIANGGSTSIYLNDSQTAKVTGAGGSNSIGSLRLGASNTGTVPDVGRTAELILYSGSHNATTRQQVFRYLGSRYGLTVV
jgi:hypothetical protein